MKTRARLSAWLFLITFALTFYGMGASFIEAFVNYPTWRLVGADEFRAFHRALSPLVIGYMVAPESADADQLPAVFLDDVAVVAAE